MVAPERRITCAQLFTVVVVLGMGVKMLMLPVLLLKSCGRDSVLALMLLLALELTCLGASIVALVLAPQYSFADLLRATVGKVAAKIVCIVFAVYFLGKLILLSGEVRIFFCENLYNDFSWVLFAVPFFGLCFMFGKGTLRAIGRCTQFLFPFIAFATVVMFVLIGMGVEYAEVLPIGEFGWRTVSRTAFRYAMWYGDYSVLVVCLGAVKRTKGTAIATACAGVLASAIVLFFMFGITATFSNVCYLIRYGQSVTGMSHYALGNALQGRFDLVLYCVWMIAVFLKAGMFSYAAVYCLCSALPLRRGWVSGVLSAGLYLLAVNIPSAAGLHDFMTRYLATPALILQFVVPAVMLTVAIAGRHIDKKRGLGTVLYAENTKTAPDRKVNAAGKGERHAAQ